MSGASPLRTYGPYVPIEAVEWLPEATTRETPEDILMAREDQEPDGDAEPDEEAAAVRSSRATDELTAHLGRIPPREALAIVLHRGLLGRPRTQQMEIAGYIGAASQQVISYAVQRAQARILYLATRPAIDFERLAKFLSPERLETVRAVYTTTSFADVARERWPCPEDRAAVQRRAWMRVAARRVQREFCRALAKIERYPELADQAAALRHVLEHLGMLSHHTGKGLWSRRAREDRVRATARVDDA